MILFALEFACGIWSKVCFISSFPSIFQSLLWCYLWRVDVKSRLIAVYNGERSGTENTIEYAQEQGIPVDIIKMWFMKKYILSVIAVILILLCLIWLLPTQESDQCAICDSIPMHAPALVNLATGEVGELAVYDLRVSCCWICANRRNSLSFLLTQMKNRGFTAMRFKQSSSQTKLRLRYTVL